MGEKTNEFKKKLEMEVKRMKKQSGQEEKSKKGNIVRGGFLTPGFVDKMLLSTDLMEVLQEDFEGETPYELNYLETFIRSHGKKLYTTLILIGKSKLAKELMIEKKLDDRGLFMTRDNIKNSWVDAYCSPEFLQTTPGLADIASEFYEKQWIIPPVLSAEVHQTFPSKSFIFPFEAPSRRKSGGSWGAIYEVKIANGCLAESKVSEDDINSVRLYATKSFLSATLSQRELIPPYNREKIK